MQENAAPRVSESQPVVCCRAGCWRTQVLRQRTASSVAVAVAAAAVALPIARAPVALPVGGAVRAARAKAGAIQVDPRHAGHRPRQGLLGTHRCIGAQHSHR